LRELLIAVVDQTRRDTQRSAVLISEKGRALNFEGSDLVRFASRALQLVEAYVIVPSVSRGEF